MKEQKLDQPVPGPIIPIQESKEEKKEKTDILGDELLVFLLDFYKASKENCRE